MVDKGKFTKKDASFVNLDSFWVEAVADEMP